jgi:mono/diheme cytochrome c family protein
MVRAPFLALALLAAAPGCWHFPGLFGDARAPILYGSRCATCHGDHGRGDGPGGAALEPRPRDFANAAWQASTSDARIAQTIREGGAAVGLSPFMPPQPDLSDRQLRKLVTYIREIGARDGG